MRATLLWAAVFLVAVLVSTTAASAPTRGLVTGNRVAPHSFNTQSLVSQPVTVGDIRHAVSTMTLAHGASSTPFAAVVNRLGQLPAAGSLGSIDCASSDHCVAVGQDTNNQPLVLAGDPATWSASQAREITLGSSFGSGGYLSSVACTSSTKCFAVGRDDHYEPLVLAGDPATWSAANAREITLGTAFNPYPYGGLSSIACSSSAHCVAVGDDVNAQPILLAGDPVTWSASEAREITLSHSSVGPIGRLGSIACPSSVSCVAVGEDGNGWPIVWDGDPTTWNAANANEVRVGNFWSNSLSSIVCTSSTECVAVGGPIGSDGGQRPLVLAGDPATWSAADAQEISLGSSFGPRGGGLSSIECTSSTTCVAVGQDTNDQPLVLAGDPATWSASQAREITLGKSFGSHGSLSSVACASSTQCLALGDDSHSQPTVLAGDPATWSANNVKEIALTGADFGANASSTTLACPSATSCFDLGSYRRATRRSDPRENPDYPYLLHGDPANWDHARAALMSGHSFSYFTGMTCASPRHCAAVGYYAWPDGSYPPPPEPIVMAGNPSSWAMRKVTLGKSFGSGGTLQSIACPAPTRCVAVGGDANHQPLVMTGNPAKWRAANAKEITLGKRLHSNGALESVACTSRTHCVAVGQDGSGQPLVFVGNPSSWSTKNARKITLGKRFGSGGLLSSVACPSRTYCVSVGQSGKAARPLVLAGNPARWAARSAFTPRVPAAKATSVKGFFTEARAGTGSLISISCRSKTSCVAVGGDSHAAPLFITGDPRKWKGQPMARPATQGASFTRAALTSADCIRKTCFVGGYSNGGDFVATLKTGNASALERVVSLRLARSSATRRSCRATNTPLS